LPHQHAEDRKPIVILWEHHNILREGMQEKIALQSHLLSICTNRGADALNGIKQKDGS
jgi:hypothetical protein